MVQNQQYVFETKKSYSKDMSSTKVEIRRSTLDGRNSTTIYQKEFE